LLINKFLLFSNFFYYFGILSPHSKHRKEIAPKTR